MNEGEKKGLIHSVGSWIWGTVEGGFNEQQSTSQVIVDALIGMIPVIGDATAIRDLIAVLIRLIQHPEKRKEKGEWILLVILLFALVPIAGGAIKGIGLLMVKGGEELARTSSHIAEFVKALNRIGEGDAVKWFKSLDLEAYLPMVRAKWLELTGRLTTVTDRVLVKMRHLLPDSMLEHLAQIKAKLGELMEIADRMIPDALKDLNARLKQIQRQLYEGEYHAIPASFKSSTREAEARIVVTAEGKTEWEMANAHFPQDGVDSYKHVEGLPDLREVLDSNRRKYAIAGFCGEIRAVKIPGGTKIYRILNFERPNALGAWWAYELPANGRRWREDYAVLDDFSKNRLYVEFEVPPQGLVAWEGTVASQIDRSVASDAGGQYLPGGATQLFVSFSVAKNKYAEEIVLAQPLRETKWTDHMKVNVPERTVTAQGLGQHEVATKKTPVQTAERLTAKAVDATAKSPSEERKTP